MTIVIIMGHEYWPPVPSPEKSLSSDRRSPPSALLLRAAALLAARRRPTPRHPHGPGRPPPATAETTQRSQGSQGPTAGANGRTWLWLLKSLHFRIFDRKKRGKIEGNIKYPSDHEMLKISSGNLAIFNDIQMFHHFLTAVSKSMRFCRWQLRHFNPSSKDHHSPGR